MFPPQVLMAFMLLGFAASTHNIYIDTRMPEDEISPVLRRGKSIFILVFFLRSLMGDSSCGRNFDLGKKNEIQQHT
jgi:hypothetical protein